MIYPVPKPQREPKRPKPPKKGQRAKRTGGHAFPALVSKSRRAFIKRQRCIATGVRTGDWVIAKDWMPGTLKSLCPYKALIVPAHIKSRGSSGPDVANMVPLEFQLHNLLGTKGEGWLVKACRLMPLKEVAADFEERFLARAAAIEKNIARRESE